MKAGWEVKPLGEVCTLKPPKKLAKAALGDDELVSFAGMSELGELRADFEEADARPLSKVYSGYTYFADNDVLVAKITPCFENGKMGIARNLTNGIGFGSSEFVPLRLNGELTPEFLFYYLLRDRFRSDGAKVMSGAVGHKRVPHDYFLDLQTPIPTLEEQKRIVAVLDAAFEGLTRATENAKANLQNARELFEADLRSTFETCCKRHDLVELNQICDVRDGTHDSPSYVEQGIPFVTQKNVREHGLILTNTKRISEKDHLSISKRSGVSKGDILISMIGVNRGMACLVHTDEPFSIKNVGLVKKTDEINMQFLLFYLKSPQAAQFVKAATNGGAQPFIGLKKLRSFPFPNVPKHNQVRLQERLSAALRQSTQLIENYSTKLTDIVDLRQSLLQKAFAGELT